MQLQPIAHLMTTTWSGCSPGAYRMEFEATMSSTTLLLLISLERNVCSACSKVIQWHDANRVLLCNVPHEGCSNMQAALEHVTKPHTQCHRMVRMCARACLWTKLHALESLVLLRLPSSPVAPTGSCHRCCPGGCKTQWTWA